MEKWQKVNSTEKYFVSNLGRLKNIKTGRILKKRLGKRGYLTNNISVKGKVKVVTIHRLIALHFITNPQNKPQVNHKDGDKTNNKISNLEWVTSSENAKHAYSIGLKKKYWAGIVGAQNHRSRPVIRIDRNFTKKNYVSITYAARENNVSTGNIGRVLSGKRKTTGGFYWEYKDKLEPI
jgi:hypothetical protein